MKHLAKLYAKNRNVAGRLFEVRAEADQTVIFLYDVIVDGELEAEWWGGVAPMAFINALNSITAPVIHLRINSPGGSVFAARAMEAAIRAHTSKIVAHIDGYAASAASFLAIACDEVEISPHAFFMIHKAWSFTWGNADDLVKEAELLNKVDESLVNSYVRETGQDADQVRTWMTDETWFSADESIQFGFADRIAVDAEKPSAAWDMSAYKAAPAATAINSPSPAPVATVAEPQANPGQDPEEQFLNESHRARQQQRMNVLARTAIG